MRSRRPIKLAFVLPTLRVGGVEKVFVEIANGLAARGYDVSILTMQLEGELQPCVHKEVRIVDLHARRILSFVFKFAAFLRREKTEVIFTSVYSTGFSSILSRMLCQSDARIVVGAHNLFDAKVNQADNWKDRYTLRFLCKHLFPKADAYAAVSKGVAHNLASSLALDRNKFRVIHNPVVNAQLKQLSRQPCDHPWLKQHRSFRTVVAVSRIVRQKGIDDLIGAFAIVLKNVPDTKLIVVGNGPLLEKMQNMADTAGVSGSVDFVGFDPNPLRFMRRADLFVSSSHWEGFGNTIVEALACGTPVVATDCPFGPREILCDGKFGCLVPAKNTQILAAEIIRLVRMDDTKELRKLGQLRSTEFRAQDAIDKYEELVEQLAR